MLPGPDCSLRSADYETPGVFHGRCAATLGHSGGARWQNCPWCPKNAAVIGVDDSDEKKYFISMKRLEEDNYAALTIQRMEMVPQKDCASGRIGEETAREVTEGQETPAGFAGGSQRQEKGGDSQGDAIHLES